MYECIRSRLQIASMNIFTPTQKMKCLLHLLPVIVIRNMEGEPVNVECLLLTSKSLYMRTHQRIKPLNPTENTNQ